MDAAAPRFSLLGDQPYEGADDPLGFEQLAASLADLILASRGSTPLTVGIEAGWGMGKSTLMRAIARRLRARPDVHTVAFNAWTARDGDALEGLLKSVLDELDPNILRRALRNERLKALGKATGRVLAKWAKVDPLVDELWAAVKVDPQARNELGDLVRAAMNDWTRRNAGPDGRLLVVFVDDLDRCSPANVFGVFEAIKLHLNAAGFVFVVGYDKDIVSDAILREKQYSANIRSRDYLEKILQIDYPIPAPSETGADALVDRCLELSGTAGLFDEPTKQLLRERNNRNPRRIKRFINGFVLEYGREPERAEGDAERLIRWLVLRTYFPEFTGLFADGAIDPVDEFFQYAMARSALSGLQRPLDFNWAQVVAAFQTHDITPPDPSAIELSEEDLRRLEQVIPEAFPALARSPAFRSLVEPLRDPAERQWLADMLERRPAPATTAPDLRPPPGPLAGITLLWVGDHDPAVADRVRDQGALLTRITFAEFRLETPFSAVVYALGGVTEDGLRDLTRLRESYTGPVLFYAPRVTPPDRERAAALGAQCVSDADSLIARLQTLHQPVPVPA